MTASPSGTAKIAKFKFRHRIFEYKIYHKISISAPACFTTQLTSFTLMVGAL